MTDERFGDRGTSRLDVELEETRHHIRDDRDSSSAPTKDLTDLAGNAAIAGDDDVVTGLRPGNRLGIHYDETLLSSASASGEQNYLGTELLQRTNFCVTDLAGQYELDLGASVESRLPCGGCRQFGNEADRGNPTVVTALPSSRFSVAPTVPVTTTAARLAGFEVSVTTRSVCPTRALTRWP
jgi:hypothetical protein